MPIILRLRVEPPEAKAWIRLYSYSLSLAIHSCVLGLLFNPVSIPGRDEATETVRRSLREQDVQRKRKIIWLRKGDRLPLVDSGDQRALKLPHAEEKSPQTAFTSPKRPEAKKQFIFTDLPQIAPQKEIPSPNLVSLAAATSVTPPPPRRELRQFRPPEPQARTPAPQAELTESLPGATTQAQLQIPTPPPLLAENNPKLPRPPTKQFVLPSDTGTKAGGGKQALIEAQPLLETAAQSTGVGGGVGTVTLAILSANPSNTAPPPAGVGNRADAVQVGGVPGGVKNGGEGGGGNSAVPGLTVRGEKGGVRPTLAAATSPNPMPATSAIPTRPAPLPPPMSTPTVSIPQWPNARRVPKTVEASFPDRPVYVTILKPPSGLPDWVLWFSDTMQATPGVRVFMRPPVPRQMEWGARADATANWPESIWLKARLTKDGNLTGLIFSEGAAQESLESISQIMGRWLFSPAVRNGVAVETDVLMEISFRRPR